MPAEPTPQIITQRFTYDGGREVTISIPSAKPEAIVYAGDGQLISRWGAPLDGADVPPTMIVGVHRTSAVDEMVRITEYSPGFDPEVFTAHEKFFTQDVRSWVEAEFDIALPPERTAVCGVSASGELSLALGLRHPDIYGHVFSMSPGGGYRPPKNRSEDTWPHPHVGVDLAAASIDPNIQPGALGSIPIAIGSTPTESPYAMESLPSILPRVYLTAGTLEPFFLENATRWAEALKAAGADVVMTERHGNHGDPFWAEEFPCMVRWAFGVS